MANMNNKKIKEIIERYFQIEELEENKKIFLNNVIDFEIENEYDDNRKDKTKQFIRKLLENGEK